MNYNRSPNVTPFIPPLRSPDENSPPRPPVIPNAQTENLPSWATQPQTPGNFPTMYPGGGSGSYHGTPYIPPTNGFPTPAVGNVPTPGSYFPAPANLPPQTPYHNSAQLGPNGFSSDYTGYPSAAAAGPAGGPSWSQQPPMPGGYPHTPYQPVQPPMGRPAYDQFQPPNAGWGAPAGQFGPPQPYTPWTQGMPGMPGAFGPQPWGNTPHQGRGGQLPQGMGGMGGGPMGGIGGQMGGMGGQMGGMGSQMGGMGGPMGGMGGPMGGMGGMGGPMGGMGGPMDGMAGQMGGHSRRPSGGGRFAEMARHLSRGRGVETDLTQELRFAPGRSYGPVLDPLLLHKVQAKIKINPLLASSEDNPDGDFLNWNMLYRSATCRRSSDREQQSWMIGRDDPATFPRVKMIRIVCKGLPWVFTINALDPEAGLTCGEVIDGIDEHLVKYTSKEEITTASNQRDILTSYRHNRSVHGPGGRLGQAILRKDWLLNTTAFAGITKNDSLAKAHCGGALLPCTFELKCETGFRPSADELEDEDNYDREQERERERRGRRSRHSSMSRPKSRPTSGLNVIE